MEPGVEFALTLAEAATHRARAQELITEASRRMEHAARLARERGAPRFSIVRAINSLGSIGRVDGAEAEILSEAGQRADYVNDPHCPTIPLPLLASRALTITGTGASGSSLVDDPARFAVSALYPYSTVVRLGATVAENVRGNFHVPIFPPSTGAAWLAETGTATAAAEGAISQIQCAPRRVTIFR